MAVTRLRQALWPDTLEMHRRAVEGYLQGDNPHIDKVLVAESSAGELMGFIELRIRNYAEGSEQAAVPCIEDWFVVPEQRGKRIGAKLVEAAEAWARDGGFDEIASDTVFDNLSAQQAHEALGFEEVERTVHYLKSLR